MGGVQRLLNAWDQFVGLAVCYSEGVSVGQNVRFRGRPIIARKPGSQISIGARTVCISDGRYTALGVRGPTVLRTLTSTAEIRIGEDVGLSGVAICSAAAVTIDDGSLLGADVMIFDNDFHPIDHLDRRYAELDDPSHFLPVVIEQNVFVGTRSIICKGVRIGKNSVIGAGSVVTNSVPENCVYAGSPARFIRSLNLLESR
jgi:acetyltransferase-like isoleucine patch superfamily enzyme